MSATIHIETIYFDQNKKQVRPETIDEDFRIIAQRFRCVRTYTSLYGMDAVPDIAEKYGLTVIMGVWIGSDMMENMHDLDTALAAAKNSPNVTHILVGNEALFFDVVSPKYIYLYLRYANARTKIPVSSRRNRLHMG